MARRLLLAVVVALGVLGLATSGALLLSPKRGDVLAGIDHVPGATSGSPWTPQPIHVEIGQHPFLAASQYSNLHGGGGNADVNLGPGPLGRNTYLHSRRGTNPPGGMIATTVFTRDGNLISFVGAFAGFELDLLAPRSLHLLARFDLPQRPSTFAAVVTGNMDRVMADTSGGAYFYLDNEDRVVLADADQHVVRIGHRELDSGWEFYVADDWDVSAHVPNDCLGPKNWFPEGECDPITSVMPDGNGRIWWVTLHGRVGTVDPRDGTSRSMQFAGEQIQNTFAADTDQVYVLTDHALYGMQADDDGLPTVIWRQDYERGGGRKVGNASYGSGTSPTLVGDDWIAIADNGDPRDQLLVYRRARDVEGERLVCAVPLFADGHSAVELSLVAWNRSIVAANSFGYWNAYQQRDYGEAVGGISRIDVREDGSGCDVVWTSDARNPSSVVRMSAEAGLIYAYTVDEREGTDVWSLTALDARTGEGAFETRVGVGNRFDNSWAPLTIGPDGTAYIGIVTGMISLWDEPPPS